MSQKVIVNGKKIKGTEGEVKKALTPGRLIYLIFAYAVLLFIVLVSVGPILWVIMSSFKSNGAILGSPFSLPDTFNFDAYEKVINQFSFGTYAMNSVLIASTSTVVAIVLLSMSSYVIAKYNFPLKNLIYVLLTVTLLVPGHTKTQPIFSLIMNLNLYDTKFGLFLVYLSSSIASSLFILRSNFASIPKELNEAAEIDGAGFFRTFWQINMPLAKTGIFTAGILMFLGNWNEYYFASLLTSSPANRTLPVSLASFNQAFSYDYTRMFAALTLVVLPGIIIYMLAQEQVQASVAGSAVKG
ncbi:MAG: carbohydrate ABC transporter permease [Clostridia bacterium]|nr:carbohydrate ABC transporter permease [Clostridia bacterium]